MKKLLQCMMATLLLAGSAFAGSPPTRFLFLQPDATAPAPIERTAHVITVKNVFGWADALEVDHATPGAGFDAVEVDVTNCHGFGPLPSPLSVKFDQNAAYEGNTATAAPDDWHGLFAAQCIDQTTFKSFAVANLGVRNGAASLYTRAEYKTSIGKDFFDIPELPDALAYRSCTPPAVCGSSYTFNRVWSNGDDSRSAYVAFVNIGNEGNVRITVYDDKAGTFKDEIVYLHKGDTFYEMQTKLPFGRVVMTVPPPGFGCGGCTPESLTPKIYAVIFRGHKGAGVAKAIVPELRLSIALP